MISPSRLVLALVVLAVACTPRTGVRVESSATPHGDFTHFRTYAWSASPVEAPGRGIYPTAPVGWRVRDAVDRELAGKGYAPASTGTPPDFVISYRVDV